MKIDNFPVDFRYTAIVLKKKEVGETDRLYTFLTKEGGKIRAKAVGVRKPHAKLASSLETLMLSDIAVVRGKGTGKVAGAVVEDPFIPLRSDFDMLALGLEAAEMVDALVGLDESDERIFSLFLECIRTLDALSESEDALGASLVVEGFSFQLFSELGYHLETSLCAVSGSALEAEACFFSPGAGGIVHADHADEYSISVSGNAVKLLRLFLTNRIPSLPKIRVDRRDLEEIGRIRKIFTRHILR